MKSIGKGSSATGLKAVSDEKILRVMRQSNKLRNRRRLRLAITSTGKPRSAEWTLQEQALLGKMPDAETAKRLGRTIVAIRVRRQRLGIPNYGRPFRRWTPRNWRCWAPCPTVCWPVDSTGLGLPSRANGSKMGIPNLIEGYHRWRPEDDAILGQRPDEYIARLLGISVVAVQRRRHALKIHRRPPTPRFFKDWTQEEDALLGAAPDAQIARRLKCARTTVALRRRKLKIPAYVPNWTPEEDALLKQFNEREVARRLGRTLTAVNSRRRKLGLPQIDPPFVWWKPAEDKLLGTAPGAEIALRLGRSIKSLKIQLSRRRRDN